MSEHMHNETLDQQRRARQEFLELKRMQHGEMDAGPKPSEVAIVPKTPMEKLKNIWFHDKWFILGGLAIVVTLAIMIAQCAARVNYDLEIVAYTYSPLDDTQLKLAGDYLSQFCDDINGDGEVRIRVVNCTFSKDSGNTQYQYSISAKLQAILAADANALLFITDSESYKYLIGLGDEENTLFEGEPVPLNEAFYDACQVENSLFILPEGLMLSCRSIDGKTIASDKKIADYYEQSQKILTALR